MPNIDYRHILVHILSPHVVNDRKMNSEFSRIYLQIIFDKKKHVCTKQYIGKQFWEIHNSIFVFREKEVSHNLKILALKNMKCQKNGQTCQENQNGKICVTMFLMNHQNNQPPKKVQWVEIFSDGAFLSLFHKSFFQFFYHYYIKVL